MKRYNATHSDDLEQSCYPKTVERRYGNNTAIFFTRKNFMKVKKTYFYAACACVYVCEY